MIGQLKLNEDTGRIELDGNGLHAGDPLRVLIINQAGVPEWASTRIEYDHSSKTWLLIGLFGYQVNGLFAEI
jgi:hypothetical protein